MQREPGFLGRTLFRSYYQAGEGKNLALPKSGVKLFFFLLVSYPWRLIALNIITIVFSIPLFTIPASITALFRVCVKLSMQGYCDIFGEYFSEWKRSVVRYLPFFAASVAPVGVCFYLAWRAMDGASTAAVFAFTALGAIVSALAYLLGCYAYALFAYVDLGVKQNIKNAFFFLFTQRYCNFLLIMLPLLPSIVLALFLPYTAVLFALCHVSIVALMIACIVKPALVEHAILPKDAAGGISPSEP